MEHEEDKRFIPALFRCFNPERLKGLDPNKPENIPVLKAQEALKNQGYLNWYEGPGQYVVDRLEKSLIYKVSKVIESPTNTVEDIIRLVNLVNEIKRDCMFVDRIVLAFEEEEKRTKLEQ